MKFSLDNQVVTVMRQKDVIEDFDVELQKLMSFYDVDTKDQLIMVQASQIEMLQHRLRELTPKTSIDSKVRRA